MSRKGNCWMSMPSQKALSCLENRTGSSSALSNQGWG